MSTRDTLLLAGGSAAARSALRTLFQEDFNLLEADSNQQAKLLLEQNCACIAVVILDLTAGKKLTRSVLPGIRAVVERSEIPVVVITDDRMADVRLSYFDQGVTDVYTSDIDPDILQQRIYNMVELCHHRWHLEERVAEQAETLRHSNDAIVDTLSSIIEYRSVESGQHILRIRRFTQLLLEEVKRSCPEYSLTEETIRIISSASALHDIGKISIPDRILNKPGRLSDEEWDTMKTHSLTGCRILESLADFVNQDYLRYAHNICHYHHERWDGGGYPEGISGDQIPICAQTVGLVDAYDALISNRVYKEACSFEQAANMILNGECGIFSPKLLECFKQVKPQLEQLARAYADGLSPKAETFDVTLPPPEPQDSRSSLQTVQDKYLAMLHYSNAAVIEVDLDQNLYHLVYNPDPDLFFVQSGAPFHMLESEALQYISPEDRERFSAIFREAIPAFFREGLHHQKHDFRVLSRTGGKAEPYTLTFLRLDPSDLNHRRMLLLLSRTAAMKRPSPGPSVDLHDFLTTACRCRNNDQLTLCNENSDISFLVGYTPEELRQQFGNSLAALAVPQDQRMIRRRFNEQLAVGREVELTYQVRHRNGHLVWLLHKGYLAVDEDGSEYIDGILIDISRVKSAQNNNQLSLEQYQMILASTGYIVFDWDLEADIISFSRTWQDIFGYVPIRENASQALATSSHFHPDDMLHFLDWANELRSGGVSRPGEFRIANKDGRYLWCRFRATIARDSQGNVNRLMGTIVNINAEKQATRELQQQAEQDSLTKLFRKEAARQRAEEYFAQQGPTASCALLVIDLDNFKQVNDQYGHLFGDSVLVQAASQLKKLFRSLDIIGRIGGDEFMVLMRDIPDRELVERRCRQLLTAFDEIFRSQVYDCPLNCSIGVAISPDDGVAYTELFQRADQALYQAKAQGKGRYVFYDGADPVYHQFLHATTTRIDSEERPGLASNSIVQYAFRHLYSSNDMERAVNDILELVGRQLNVSRVYVFENTQDNRFCNNTFEWCSEGVEPQIHNLQNISYETDIPGYEKNFDEHGIFYCPDVEDLPSNLYEIVAPQGIKSMLHCAIRDNGVFRGYIGFDECTTKHFWTKDQVEALTCFSAMLSVFLLKERAAQEIARRAADFTSILDNQKAWIYVIDPDSCELHFLNARTREIAPEAKAGMLCHKALMGLDSRCPDCPARDIRSTKNCECSIVNELFNLHVLSEATLIRWGGEDACLISCRELNPQERR